MLKAFSIICKEKSFTPVDGIREIIHVYNKQQRPQDATPDTAGSKYEYVSLIDTN